MAHFLPLSRVARLVGQSRAAVQRMIHDGELVSFDGMVDMNELLRVFPDVRWEDDGEYSRVQQIKERAFGRRVFERALPDKEVLAERLFELGREYAAAKTLLLHYDEVLRFLREKLDEVAESGGATTLGAVADVKQWLKRELDSAPGDAERAAALLARESVMRIMSAQVTIQPSGHEFTLEGNDTLLEAALRVGLPLNYGCSNGNCGECRARLISGQLRKVHPHDFNFREHEKANGAFLLCAYTAVTDVVIEASIAGAADIPQQTIPARVRSVEHLGEHVAALHLTTPRSQRLRFLAGQSVKLSTGDGVSADYHVASCPCEDRHITIHVRRDDEPFPRLVFGALAKDDVVNIEGPHGGLVYNMESRRPAVFVALDDGFGPIQSLIQHAMSLEIADDMYLYWVAERTGHYLDNLCRSWTDALDNFHYLPLTMSGGVPQVVEAILAGHPDLAQSDMYAVGPAVLLDALRAAALARGLSPHGWHGEGLD
jgi:CDP-4-dehydro-6-deoxyglucose reductase, E3